MPTTKISMKCVFLRLIILRPHLHFTRHVHKKNLQNHPHITRLKIRKSGDPRFTGGPRGLDKSRTRQLADATGSSSFGCNCINLWTENTAPVTACARSNKRGSHVSLKILESPEFLFIKFPGRGKSWKMKLVLESPGI